MCVYMYNLIQRFFWNKIYLCVYLCMCNYVYMCTYMYMQILCDKWLKKLLEINYKLSYINYMSIIKYIDNSLHCFLIVYDIKILSQMRWW